VIVSLTRKAGGIIYTIIGCNLPIILRKIVVDAYTVVGDCYIYGLIDSESLLGPLPTLWTVRPAVRVDLLESSYLNLQTNTNSLEDPRLGSLPAEWGSINQEKTPQRSDLIRAAPKQSHWGNYQFRSPVVA